jgi:hypothetical protein
MPLIDLKTDLKSLKYGKDRPGGGDSGQPYQKVDINTVDSGFNRFRMTKFDDGLVRGGVVGAANAAVVDTLRIGKFLTDFPKGPLFIVKQIGLQLSNPQLETKKLKTDNPTKGGGLLRNVGNFALNTANKLTNAIGPTRIYNLGINTIAQVPVGAFGIHFNRHGLLPVQDDQTKYLAVAQNNNNEENNRLAGLRNRFGLGANYDLYKGNIKLRRGEQRTLSVIAATFEGGVPFANSVYNDIQNSRIADYVGGPNSVYGIGRTLIQRVPERTNDSLKIDYAKNRNFNSQHITDVKISSSFDFGISLLTNSSLASTSFNLLNDKLKDSFLNFTGSTKDYHGTNKDHQQRGYDDANNKIKTSLGFVGVSTKTSSSFISNKLPDLTDFGMLGEFKRNTLEDQNINTYSGSITWTPSTGPKTVNKYADLGLTNLTTGEKEDIDANDFTTKGENTIRWYSPSAIATGNVAKYAELRQAINNRIANKQLYTDIGENGGRVASPLLDIIPSVDNYNLGNPVRVNNVTSSRDGSTMVGRTQTNQNKVQLLPNYNLSSDISKKIITVNVNRSDKDFKYVSSSLANQFKRTNDKVVDEDTLALKFMPLDPFTGNVLRTLKFLGYITDYSETYDSTWNPIKYAGRNENFYIFNEFKRTATVGFNIPCFNSKELEQKHCDMSELASVLAGKYQDNLLLGGIITRLKIGRYIDDQPGIITNLTFSPIQDSSWDLDAQLAFYLKVSFGFTLIHNFLPQYGKCGFIDRKPDPIPEPIPTPTPTPEDDDRRTNTTISVEDNRALIDSTLNANLFETKQRAELDKNRFLPPTKTQTAAAKRKFESLKFSD